MPATEQPAATPSAAKQATAKQPAAQRAYEHTKSLLLDGEAEPGRMLSEGEIAAAVGVSRTPVREAFTRLQSEGWLRLYPRRGALVVPPDTTQARDVVDARVLLETASLQATATDDLPGLTDALTDALYHQRQALEDHDLAAFADHDLAFHRALIEAGGNGVYLRFHDLIVDQERRMSVRSLWRSDEAAGRVVSQHADLITAVGQGDVDAFRAALRHHLEDIHSRLLT